MIMPVFLQKINVAVLFCFFFITLATGINAQDQKAIDTIAYILKHHKDVEAISKELNSAGNYFLNKNELDNAEFVKNEFIKFAKDRNYEKGIYDAYSIGAFIALRKNDTVKARTLAKEWLIDATNNSSDYGINGANHFMARLLYNEGKMDSVLELSNKILEAKHTSYDSINFPKFNALLGNVYLKQGDYRVASEYYLKALAVAEKTGNEQLQSVCIGNLAVINKELKNYREAIKYHNQALSLRLKNNMLHDVAGTYIGLATCYENLQLNDSSVILYRKALDLFTKFESKQHIAMVNNNLGQMLVSMNQLDTGMYFLQQAKQNFTLLNDSINLAYNAWAIGDAWWEISYWKENKSYLNEALKEMQRSKTLAEKMGMVDLEMNCHKSLSTIYEDMGNEGQAFKHLKLYNLINDSLRSEQYTNQIAEMQTKYDTEKKELDIQRLSAAKLLDMEKIARQKTLNYSLFSIASLMLISGVVIFSNVQKKRTAERQVAILEKQNAIETMRSKIASDVHDEMGANLTRLGLNAQELLLSKDVPEKEKILAEKMTVQSKEIITGMREIIWSSNPANDNLKSMLGFMRQYIDRFFDGTNIRPIVNFPHDVGEVMLHPEVRRNLFLILKESLNNTVKYSDSDRVEIDFHNENEKFNLNIKDFGKGIDDKIKDEFSNGLQNMQMRAEQIQSLFKLITAPGKGVQIIVEGKLY